MRGILFDLDDTLIPEWPALRAAYAAIAERVWGEASPSRIDALQQAARKVWRAGVPSEYRERLHYSLGEGLYGEFVAPGPEADALRAFVPELRQRAFEAVLPTQWRGASGELVDLWRDVRIESLTRYPETVNVLEHWRARVPLALVTNGASRLQWRKLVATGLTNYFSTVVVSEDVGVGKPDPAMFEVALRELELDRCEVVMVGNDPDRDVAGAIRAGIKPIRVRREDSRSTDQRSGDVDEIADLTELTGLIAAPPA